MSPKIRRPDLGRFSRPKSILVIALNGLIVVCAYLLVLHSHYYHSSLKSWAMAGLFGGVSALQIYWIDPLFHSRWPKYFSALCSIGLAFVGFVALLRLQTHVLDEQRRRDGVNSSGQVTFFEMETHRRQQTKYAVFEYRHEGRTYTQRIPNQPARRIGDTLPLRFARADPENVVVTDYDCDAE